MAHALGVFVDAAEGLESVGIVSDGEAGVVAARNFLPDVVLMDMHMPVMNGVDTTRAIVSENPEIKVIAVTTFASDEYLVPALRAGASGYLVKDARPEEIVAAIREVHAGGSVISPRVTQELISAVRSAPIAPSSGSDAEAEAATLSDRELQVVQGLARGLSNLEIAEELSLSEATVKGHMGRVMAKWQLRDRVQVLVHAASLGIVQLGALPHD